MPDMTPTSLAAAVVPRTVKLLKMILKEEKICYKMAYYTLHLGGPTVNCRLREYS